MQDRIEGLKNKAQSLPLKPGVYLMKDKDGKIIYVGKAKNLKNRASSYFMNIHSHNPKTFALVSQIYDFDVIVVGSEFEALLLESNLIKKHSPHYNILLKDDKGYPFVKVNIKDDYPIITISNKRDDKNAKYYGPFGSRSTTKALIDAVNKTYKLPSCNGKFKNKNICLFGRVGRCMKVCEGSVSKSEYQAVINDALDFFEGKTSLVKKKTEENMFLASENLDFERAAYYRDIIKSLSKLSEHQKIIERENLVCDAVALCEKSGMFCFTVMSVKNGQISSKNSFLINEHEITDTDIFSELICRYYESMAAVPNTIYIYEEIDDIELILQYIEHISGHKVNIVCPKKGDGRKIVDLCYKNAYEYIMLNIGKNSINERRYRAFCELCGFSDDIKLIEAYDISNTFGTDNVCGMIVFENGKPCKNKYRKFMIKTFEGASDTGAMEECLNRRLMRYKNGDEGFSVLPDLIVADGGINQINAIKKSLLSSGLNITVVGLLKNRKHRTEYLVKENGSRYKLSDNNDAYVFAGRLQEEVHRFAVKYHRNKSGASVKATSLTQIEGVGKVTARNLLLHFKTIKSIKEASVDDLLNVKGVSKKTALNIYEYYNKSL